MMLYSLSLSCSELDSGTLGDNAVQDGTEIRLVPAVESGVTVRFLWALEQSSLKWPWPFWSVDWNMPCTGDGFVGLPFTSVSLVHSLDNQSTTPSWVNFSSIDHLLWEVDLPLCAPFPFRLESYIFMYSTTFLQVKFLSDKSRISSQKNKAIPLNTNALSLLVLVHVLCLVQLCAYQDKSSCWRSLFSTPFSSHHPLSQATTQPFQW